MLMLNPDYQVSAEQEFEELIAVESSREMLVGQFRIVLIFVIAILLRSLALAS